MFPFEPSYVYNEDDCPWYYFDSSYKTLLGACLIVFGTFGVLLNGWLYVTFLYSHLLSYRSHLLVLNLCTASLGRNILGFPFAAPSAILKSWIFTSACCQHFAFFNQFFGIFQLSAIAVLVLERYLTVKCCRKGRILHLRLYWILISFCWANSAVFAIPPLFGFGKYSCDATGTCCTFSWPSLQTGTKQLGFCVPFVIFCSILPIVFIFYYMGKTVRLEKIYYRSHELKEKKQLTRTVHALTVATLAFWIPAAVLIGYQWIPPLVYGYRIHVPGVLALVAPIASEAATCVPVLCYLVSDERLRAALIGRMQNHYALLHPTRAQKFLYGDVHMRLLTE